MNKVRAAAQIALLFIAGGALAACVATLGGRCERMPDGSYVCGGDVETLPDASGL